MKDARQVERTTWTLIACAAFFIGICLARGCQESAGASRPSHASTDGAPTVASAPGRKNTGAAVAFYFGGR